jgi:hypothetical protein
MKASRKDRRSKRVPAEHRVLLTILNATGLEIAKEIVTTVEVSLHGARVRGIRTFRQDSQGMLTQLSSGSQAPVRIAWQAKAASSPKFLDTGVEFLSAFDFWGATFSEPLAEVAAAAGPEAATPAAAPPPISPQGLLEQLETSAPSAAGDRRARALEAAWCSLIEQLEERKVFTRDELLASLRNMQQKFRSGPES